MQGNKGDGPEATLVSDDEDSDENDSSNKYDNTFWYKPKKLIKPKVVSFAKDTKAPASESHKSQSSFEVGMNLVLKDGAGNTVSVVYEGVAADGLAHTVRTKDSTTLSVQASHLAFLNQMDMGNIPSTPLDYCREVGTGIMCKKPNDLQGLEY